MTAGMPTQEIRQVVTPPLDRGPIAGFRLVVPDQFGYVDLVSYLAIGLPVSSEDILAITPIRHHLIEELSCRFSVRDVRIDDGLQRSPHAHAELRAAADIDVGPLACIHDGAHHFPDCISTVGLMSQSCCILLFTRFKDERTRFARVSAGPS